MKRSIVLKTVIVIGGMALNGCMMMGMSGGMMGGDGSQRAHDTEESERIVKELIFGDYRLIAEFPPLRQGQESLLSLHIHSSDSSRAITAFARMIISREKMQEGIENILIIQEMLTPFEAGIYAYSFTPRETGQLHLTFLVERLGDSTLNKPLMFTATQEVKAMTESEMDNNKQGGFSLTPLLIAGGVVMVAMMLLMFGSRHF